MRFKAMLEERAKLTAEIKRQADLIQAGGDHTPEQKEAWDKVNSDYEKIVAEIEAERRTDQAEAKELQKKIKNRSDFVSQDRRGDNNPFSTFSPARNSEETRANALVGWLSAAVCRTDPTEEQDRAMQECGVRPDKELVLSGGTTYEAQQIRRNFLATPPSKRHELAQYRGPGADSLVTGTTTAAGYLIPPGVLQNALEVNMLAFGGMRQVADVIKTPTGEPFFWPTADDTTNTGEQLDEVADIGSSVNPTIGRISFSAFKFSSKLIRFSSEMLQDSAFNLLAILGAMLGERLGRITNTKYTVGAGTTTPSGVVTGAASAFTSAAATAITADELIDLFHSVDPAYRDNATFMANDATIKSFRKLKTGAGEYLWSAGGTDAGIAGGFADTLLGRKIVVNQDVAAMTAGLKPLLFGYFSRYKIRSVSEIRIRRFTELYGQTDEEGLIAFIREDGHLLNAGTNPVKYITMYA